MFAETINTGITWRPNNPLKENTEYSPPEI